MAYGTVGRPVSEPRSSFAERKAQREAFRQMKIELANSPEEQARRAKKQAGDMVTKARRKLRKALAGVAIEPFTMAQIGALNPVEMAQLEREARGRLGKLTEAERDTFKRNSWAALLSFSVPELKTIAAVL